MISELARPIREMGFLRRIVGAAVALAAVGCGPPIQNGGVFVLPGATERLILAMRMGYHGVGEAKPAAAVHTASTEDLLQGSGASGKVGDYVLENGSVVAIVAAIDGTDRSGTLVDFARNPARSDELANVTTTVFGHPVRYTTAKTGTDDVTGAAYVEVSGTSGSLSVSTRYDLAPELDAILVHTSFTRPPKESAPEGSEPDAPLDVADRLALDPSAVKRFDAAPRSLAAFAARGGYVLVPLVATDAEPGTVVSEPPAESSEVIGLAHDRATEGVFIYSRFLSPLERPDTLSLVSALAVADGRELGDVEFEIAPEKWTPGLAIRPGKLVLTPRLQDQGAGGAPVEMDVQKSVRAGDHVVAKVPSGTWDVRFTSDEYHSRKASRVVVRPRLLNGAEVKTERIPTPASAPVVSSDAPPTR